MNRKLKRKLRLLQLCRKYGYKENETLLRRKLRKQTSPDKSDETPILFNLSREEEIKE
ncbi:hypothetical protein J7M28_02010 [bacterium]|nr:hypothetical protein [bacterium]